MDFEQYLTLGSGMKDGSFLV